MTGPSRPLKLIVLMSVLTGLLMIRVSKGDR